MAMNVKTITSLTRLVAHKAARRLKRYVAPLMPEVAIDTVSFEEMLVSLGRGNLDWFVDQKRNTRLIAPFLDRLTLRETYPPAQRGALSWLKDKTDHCLAGRFCELGSEYTDLCDSDGGIRWLEDFKSRVSWPLTHQLRTSIIKNDNVSDIKIVWELSRFQFAPNLAQMEALTGDSKYRKRFVELIDDWQRKNPYPLGPNWNCSMEVAIRALNILFASELFELSGPLPAPFVRTMYVSLYQHGLHIRNNLENLADGLNTNHYLANLIGLLTLGKLFEALPDGKEWLDYAREELTQEIESQTTEDGFCYESSANYHLMVLEFYLYALAFCRQNEITLPISFMRRLSNMVRFTEALQAPNGKLPNIGDNDSGRLFKLAPREDRDPGWLLAWAQMEGIGGNSPTSTPMSEPETVWFYGYRRGIKNSTSGVTTRGNAGKHTSHSCYFRDSGIVILRDQDLMMTVNVSDIGVNGLGGHKHNDQLALTLCWSNDEFLIDPGTLCYTKCEAERNRLRSCAAHSTVTIGAEETNRFPPGYMFSLRKEGAPHVSTWLSTPELDLLRAEHDCYQRLPGSPVVARTIYFDKQRRFWLIRDEVMCSPGYSRKAPGWRSSLIVGDVDVSVAGLSAVLQSRSSANRIITISALTTGTGITSENFVFAPSYGVSQTGTRLFFTPAEGAGELIWLVRALTEKSECELDSKLLAEKLRLLEWPTETITFAENFSACDPYDVTRMIR